MKLGICCGFAQAKEAKEAGFDYFEPAFSSLYLMPEEEIARISAELKEMDFYAEAMNGMLPGHFKLCTEDGDLSEVYLYLDRSFRAARSLGTKVVVFGSGTARRLPDDWSKERGLERLADYLRHAGDLAAKYDIFLAIEPLRKEESNIIHTVQDGWELCQKADHPQVGVLADWYHMAEEKDMGDGILNAGNKLLHCHIARTGSRLWPQVGDEEEYPVLMNALRKVCYQGRISVEGTPIGTMALAQERMAQVI